MKNPAIIAVAAIVLVMGGLFVFNAMSDNNSSNQQDQMPATDTTNIETEQEQMDGDESESAGETIVDIAAGNPDFSTLVTAVTQAGLVETLSSDGPFTVFAPTNAAFEALGQETIDAVLADKEQLTSILTYHVVEGNVTSDQVVNLTEATTVNGATLPITVMEDGTVKVGNATVVTADIQASNGVIHVIDTVLIPE